MSQPNRTILIATGIFPPDIGGPATYSKLLEDELPKSGLEVCILSFGEVRRWPKIIRHTVYFLKVLNRARAADVIYVQDPVSVGAPACLAAKLLKKKLILKVVGDYAWEQARVRFGVADSLDDFQGKRYGRRTEFFKAIERRVATAADLVITPSRYLKKIVSGWGVPDDKIRVVYNSVEPVEVRSGKDEAKKELDLSGNIILSVGRLVPWKGFGVLIELMPELLVANPEFKLVIVGEGPEYEKLKAMAAGLNFVSRETDPPATRPACQRPGMSGRASSLAMRAGKLKIEAAVVFTGRVGRDAVLKYMRAADMFVLNTGYEGLPHVVIEAMAVGVPVITTRAGGNIEVIENEKTGLLIEQDDLKELKAAILKLWHNRQLANNLAEAAKKEIETKFSRARMLEETVKLLK